MKEETIMERVYNFAPGPATIAEEVLQQAASELVNYGNAGMSVMEMSHRGKDFGAILAQTKEELRELMAIPEDYEILFLQGGATLQFAGVPLNLKKNGKFDYLDSGNFAHVAAVEAQKYGDVKIVGSSREDGYTYIPQAEGWREDADYAYICYNNTIYGTRFTQIPDTGKVPLVADMSSMILSQPVDVSKFGLIFAGAQKNIGPAGLCIVIVRRDLVGQADPLCPKLMDYALQIKNDSMVNTPNTWGIYMAHLGFEWLKNQGGVEAIYQKNLKKAQLLYDALDNSKLFKPTAQKEFRSLMNVTFVTGDEEKDAAFVKYAAARGLVSLKGHRSVGGMRASIYNAMPIEGVEKLVEVLQDFEKENL